MTSFSTQLFLSFSLSSQTYSVNQFLTNASCLFFSSPFVHDVAVKTRRQEGYNWIQSELSRETIMTCSDTSHFEMKYRHHSLPDRTKDLEFSSSLNLPSSRQVGSCTSTRPMSHSGTNCCVPAKTNLLAELEHSCLFTFLSNIKKRTWGGLFFHKIVHGFV